MQHPDSWSWTRRSFLKTSAVGLLLLGSKLLCPSIARASELPDAELTFFNVHTDERLRVRYRDQAGNYDLTALDEVNHILRCHHTGEVAAIDVQLLEHVNLVHKAVEWRRRDPRDFRLSFARVQCIAREAEPASRAAQPTCSGAGARLLCSRCQASRDSPCRVEVAVRWGRVLSAREIHPSRFRSFPNLVAPSSQPQMNYRDGLEVSIVRTRAQRENPLAGCSKRPSSKAAASEGPRRSLWGTLRVLERCENAAGGLFQHPANQIRFRNITDKGGSVTVSEWGIPWERMGFV